MILVQSDIGTEGDRIIAEQIKNIVYNNNIRFL